jgi:hypothetical protein
MSSEKYPVGTKIKMPAMDDPDFFFEGEVVDNVKMPGDICIKYSHLDFIFSYDEAFLDEKAIKL